MQIGHLNLSYTFFWIFYTHYVSLVNLIRVEPAKSWSE